MVSICNTVDGRNPAPVDTSRYVVYPIICKVFSSQVVQDFFYQQYNYFIPESSKGCQMVPLQGVNSPSFTVYLAPKLKGAGLFTIMSWWL